MGGKAFAVVLTIITLLSAYFIVAHTWWLPADISTTGPAIDRQMDETMWEAGILFLAGQLVLALFCWQYGDKPGSKIKHWPGGPKPVVAFGIIIVGLEVVALSLLGSKAWGAIYMTPAASDAIHVDVQAEQFAFFFRYAGPDGKFGAVHPELINDASGNYFGLDPRNDEAARDDIVVGSLTIPVNKPILLTLHSKDMIHDFFVPELRIQQDIVPGLEIPVHFTATKTGRWEIVCTQLCGLGHYQMKAYLQVLPQDQFDEWLKQQSGD
ncbi:MAG TPA: cytochrome C oxidase subunit II [Candidatus Sulfotelmatobacter sp.]|nr:cytochrome C oxidase subunit II [Candidatus Sulfotelmatobacter sp.]